MLGVIGGTGFYTLGRKVDARDVMTPFGVAHLELVSVAGEEMVFIPRHGKDHSLAPHMINYRANVAALEKVGVTGVLSFHSCGVVSKYKPGDLVLVDDFIGLFTPATFYDDFSGGMKHVDFSEPFSPEMKRILKGVASVNKVTLKTGGIVAATPGPRFETKSEVKLLKKLGANLLSMTCGYEMALLGESEIDFASVAIASNYATGIKKEAPSAKGVLEVSSKSKGRLLTLIQGFAKEIV